VVAPVTRVSCAGHRLPAARAEVPFSIITSGIFIMRHFRSAIAAGLIAPVARRLRRRRYHPPTMGGRENRGL